MTTPADNRDDLSALLDGELSDAEAAELERELAGDDALRAELDELRELSAGLRELGDVKAPEGFLAAVKARVEAGQGLDADGEPLPLDGPVVPPAEGADVVPLEVAAQVIEDVDATETVEYDEGATVVQFPWWLKGPAIAAVAALLVVGVGYGLRDQGPGAPPAASDVVAFAPSDAPRPTGRVESAAETVPGADEYARIEALEEERQRALAEEEDAVADVGGDGTEAERIRMEPADEDRVTVGGAGTSPAVPTAPRRSGLREVRVPAEPPPGVVAVSPGYSPEPEADAVALADEGIVAEDGGDDADSARSLTPTSPAAGALSASEPAPAAKTEARAAMTAVASLRTSDGAAVTTLRDVAAQRGWALTFVSPMDAAVTLSDLQPEQVVELQLPPGDEVAAQGVLDGLGAFRFSSTPERADGTTSRLRVTIIYSP